MVPGIVGLVLAVSVAVAGAEVVDPISTSGTKTLGDDVEITATEDGKKAVNVNSGGNVTFGENAKITAAGADTNAVKVAGLAMNAKGALSFGENAQITASGSNSKAVLSDGFTNLSFGDGTTISVTKSDSIAIEALNSAQMNFSGGATVHAADENALAMRAAAPKSFYQNITYIGGTGVFDIVGGLEAGDYGNITLGMQGDSKFTGYTDITGDKIGVQNGGQVNLVMEDNSEWNVVKDSNVYVLTMNSENAVVKFGDYDDIPDNGRKGTNPATPLADRFITLNVTKGYAAAYPTLNGTGGHFLMRTDIVNEISDKLVVPTGSTTGEHLITVRNDGSAATTGNERVTLVDTADKGSRFSLTHDVELGAWKYSLEDVAKSDGKGQTWDLHATEELPNEPDPDPTPSNPGSAAINTFIAGYLLNYAETNTLIQRLGDLRGGQSPEGAWFRGFGGNFDNGGRQYAQEFDMDYWGIQAGYDHRLENSWFKGGATYVGAFIGFSDADLNYLQNGGGKGEAENKSMGMYATYVGDNGFYVDAVAKYVWSKLNFDVLDSAGDLVTGDDVNTGGVGLSLETGKRIHFGKTGKNNGRWYVEPQAQLSWQHMGSGYFTASNGLRIGLDSYDSLLGRAGVMIGYETERTNIYAKCSYVKEFDGDMNINANGVDISESMDDDWLVYGIGVTHQMNDRNALYFDFERASEGTFTEDWAVKGGWRISF